MNRIYLCIDLKSFYASVECVARELDPLTTNLVVADKERTDKTICLAVTPSLKAYGISGRARLFEVVQRVEEINRYRRSKAPGRKLEGESYDDPELKRNPSLALSYIVAPPRMSYYMETSARIYDEEFKHLIRPLRQREYTQLEQNILSDGCRDPIVVWNDVIVDGHNRYEICMRYDIPFGIFVTAIVHSLLR